MIRYFVPAALSFGLVLGVGLSASAHSVDVTEDVAGTWHIEPDHQPKAGEPAQVWVALTRKGGELLPFDQTNCSLGVYDMPRNPNDAPILQPSLQAISAEQYQSIPGADVVFPDTGLYQIELDCQPSPGAREFTPFKMQYDVTVASAGRSAPSSTSPAANSSASPSASPSTVPIEVPIPGTTPTAPTGAANPTATTSPNSALWVQVVGLGLGAIALLLLLGLVGRLFRGKG